jgi:hypothetical protein
MGRNVTFYRRFATFAWHNNAHLYNPQAIEKKKYFILLKV